MNDDTSFDSYLPGLAASIDVPGLGAGAVIEQAHRRRRKRRAGVAAVGISCALIGAVTVAAQNGDRDETERIASYGSSLVASPLDWTMVDVNRGVGWLTADATVGDNVYALSTAPWQRGYQLGPSHLYVTADGTEWSEAPLPSGLHAGSLAGSGDHIYAVGTAASGGSAPAVRLASTTDPATGWSEVDVPLDLAPFAEGFPGKVYVAATAVAVKGGTTVVAVQLAAMADLSSLLPNGVELGWWPQSDGLHRATCGDADGAADLSTSTTLPATGESTTTEGRTDCPDEVRSWSDFGVDPAAAEILDGRTLLFASVDGAEFAPVADVARSGYEARLISGGDGFNLLVNPSPHAGGPAKGRESEASLWTSTDGIDWPGPAATMSGYVAGAGYVGGHPAAVTVTNDGTAVLHRLDVPGSTVDLNEALGSPPDQFRIGDVSFGPLGMATQLWANDGGPTRILFSADGQSFSVVDIPPAPAGKRQGISGVSVTADAVKVRLSLRPATDQTGEGPSTQRLFVGTPR